MEYAVGDVVEWTAPDQRVGPPSRNVIAIRTGDQRKVVDARGNMLMLEGQGGRGIFGFTSVDNVKLVKRA